MQWPYTARTRARSSNNDAENGKFSFGGGCFTSLKYSARTDTVYLPTFTANNNNNNVVFSIHFVCNGRVVELDAGAALLLTMACN